MMPTPESLQGSTMDEEAARAELYGLLTLLFYAPPKTELMAKLRVAVTNTPAAGAFLEEPWRALVGVARVMADQDIQSEYDTLFGGIGKPEVYLYASHFLGGFLNEKPLVRLRSELASLGLARGEGMSETEDHIAYLCEVMRYLIGSDDVTIANLTRQREFFSNHLQPWVLLLCDELQKHPKARFYAVLAEFTRAFVGVEAQGFDLLT